MSIAAEIREDDYAVRGSFTAFCTAGEYGPLACGCCVVALAFDPCGPCLVLHMERRDAEPHAHDGDELAAMLTAVRGVSGPPPGSVA